MNTFDPRYMLLQEEKLLAIIKKEKTVVGVSLELSVSRQTIHKWLSRYKRFEREGLVVRRKKRMTPPKNKTSQEIEEKVIRLASAYCYDGVVTLSDRLQFEEQITLHPTTIYRILKRNKTRYGTYYQATQRQWKKKLYAHQIAGEELQMDTKYPYGYKQGKVIYTIIDDATRWVFVWSYANANQKNTLDFLHKVLSRSPFLIQKIRTDQGTEFTGNEVKAFLQENNIIYRKNTPYCPEENGKIERFHRTLNEKGLQYGFKANDTLETMQYRLTLFLYYYNYQKRHRGLGMEGKTPYQRLAELASVNLTLQWS